MDSGSEGSVQGGLVEASYRAASRVCQSHFCSSYHVCGGHVSVSHLFLSLSITCAPSSCLKQPLSTCTTTPPHPTISDLAQER